MRLNSAILLLFLATVGCNRGSATAAKTGDNEQAGTGPLPALPNDAADRAKSANHLKQIGIAMLQCHDAEDAFPPEAICDRKGKPLLSWRVAILPYVEQKALYQLFKLDEAWDGPNNIQLLPRMPEIYQSRARDEANREHKTYYRGFAGIGTAFDGAKRVKIGALIKGASNTPFVVETSPAVAWTKPEEFLYDADRPLSRIEGLWSGEFLLLMVDGAVITGKQNVRK